MVHKKCSLNIVFLDFLLSLRCNVKCIKQVIMNSEIILEINGYKCNLLKYKYCFSRNIDREGRPVTGVLGGNIYIEMESNGSNCILDMMLVDTDRQRPAFFSHAEHFPIWGKILHSIDDMMFRELAFDEAYLYCYDEIMNATESSPMLTRFLISPTRLDINRTIRLDRRMDTTDGFWWEEYKEEEVKFVVRNTDEKPKLIIDAYWIDENGTKQRASFPDVPFTLYVQVENPVAGENVDLNFKFEESGVYKCSKHSGVINNDGIIVLNNFKLETEQHEEN